MPTPCLTTKDFTILEAMRDRCLSPATAYGRLLAHKIANANVVLIDDIAPDRVTLNTRLRYAVDDGPEVQCLLVQTDVNGTVGLTLPVTTLRGLALLGLRVGDKIIVAGDGRRPEALTLLDIDYQPEAARRERPTGGASGATGTGRVLRLVHSVDRPVERQAAPCWPDDPGPSAA